MSVPLRGLQELDLQTPAADAGANLEGGWDFRRHPDLGGGLGRCACHSVKQIAHQGLAKLRMRDQRGGARRVRGRVLSFLDRNVVLLEDGCDSAQPLLIGLTMGAATEFAISSQFLEWEPGRFSTV